MVNAPLAYYLHFNRLYRTNPSFHAAVEVYRLSRQAVFYEQVLGTTIPVIHTQVRSDTAFWGGYYTPQYTQNKGLSTPTIETGTEADYHVVDIAGSLAEPAMRYWQLSEAHKRMAATVKKRDPKKYRELLKISEDLILEYHRKFLENALKTLIANDKLNEQEALKELEAAHAEALKKHE